MGNDSLELVFINYLLFSPWWPIFSRTVEQYLEGSSKQGLGHTVEHLHFSTNWNNSSALHSIQEHKRHEDDNCKPPPNRRNGFDNIPLRRVEKDQLTRVMCPETSASAVPGAGKVRDGHSMERPGRSHPSIAGLFFASSDGAHLFRSRAGQDATREILFNGIVPFFPIAFGSCHWNREAHQNLHLGPD